MTRKLLIIIICLPQFHCAIGQQISLHDLIYFQTVKNSLKIDSVLMTKGKWDCNCMRQFERLDLVNHWVYDIVDSTKDNVDKDYIKSLDPGYGFSSVLTFYTTSKEKADIILNEMIIRNMSEEKIKTLASGQVKAKISFFVCDKFAIQTVMGEDTKNKIGKYAFTIMDKVDYLKGFEIK
jgi:hypothetical protein